MPIIVAVVKHAAPHRRSGHLRPVTCRARAFAWPLQLAALLRRRPPLCAAPYRVAERMNRTMQHDGTPLCTRHFAGPRGTDKPGLVAPHSSRLPHGACPQAPGCGVSRGAAGDAARTSHDSRTSRRAHAAAPLCALPEVRRRQSRPGAVGSTRLHQRGNALTMLGAPLRLQSPSTACGAAAPPPLEPLAGCPGRAVAGAPRRLYATLAPSNARLQHAHCSTAAELKPLQSVQALSRGLAGARTNQLLPGLARTEAARGPAGAAGAWRAAAGAWPGAAAPGAIRGVTT